MGFAFFEEVFVRNEVFKISEFRELAVDEGLIGDGPKIRLVQPEHFEFFGGHLDAVGAFEETEVAVDSAN